MIQYAKCNNTVLMNRMTASDTGNFKKVQNYCPVYNEFFILNETNFNNVRFRHNFVLHDIDNIAQNTNTGLAVIKNSKDSTFETREVFLKYAPLVDPFRYLMGKYQKENILTLPSLGAQTLLDDKHTCSYVEMLGAFLNNLLFEQYDFVHGVRFYGTFTGIQKQFKVDIKEDMDYLSECPFFKKHLNKLFFSETNVFQSGLPSIKIENDIELDNIMEINESINADKEDVLKDSLSELYNMDEVDNNMKTNCGSGGASFSGSESGSDSEEEEDDDGDEKIDDKEEEEENDDDDENADDENADDCFTDIDSDDFDYSEEPINILINDFPVQTICLEKFTSTLDNYLTKFDPSNEEYNCILMQIIMNLLTLQRAFLFTHNDLHTNNIMFSETTEEFLVYRFNKKTYKVPTFGKIFKIIDFGRSIFQVDGKRFCSNSFRKGNDAATQYNTEPFFDPKKQRVDPNFSFDLCRLGCSLLEIYIQNDHDVMQSLTPHKIRDPIFRIISEWCTDDTGKSVVYTRRGEERYPDFRLYKKIARTVHNHLPVLQLNRPEFQQYEVNDEAICQASCVVIDIDAIPALY